MSARSRRGAALVEILVALALFSSMATAIARTLAIAQRARVSSGRWMQATELGGELLEHLRADINLPESQEIDGFTRTWRRQASDHDGVERFDVSVRWIDGDEQTLSLSTLWRR